MENLRIPHLDARLDNHLGFKEAKYVRHDLFWAIFCLVEHIILPKIAKIVTKLQKQDCILTRFDQN